MAITTTELLQYSPQFNIDSGNYEDISPFVRNQRGGQTYLCPCRHSNKGFHNYTGWRLHTNNEFHKTYITHYTKIVEEEKTGLRVKVEQLEKEISQLKLENEKLFRANLHLTEIHTNYKKEMNTENSAESKTEAKFKSRLNRFERKVDKTQAID